MTVRALYRIALVKPAVRHELGPLSFVMATATTPLCGFWIPINLIAFDRLAAARLLGLPARAECDLLARAHVDAFAGGDLVDFHREKIV